MGSVLFVHLTFESTNNIPVVTLEVRQLLWDFGTYTHTLLSSSVLCFKAMAVFMNRLLVHVSHMEFEVKSQGLV